MAETDYYELLGVARDATADAIKKGYRAQARKFHPDVNPGDKKAEARFKEVQQAYDILSDGEKRALYDRYGRAAFEGMAAGPRPGAGAGPQDWVHRSAGPDVEGFDFSEFFRPGGTHGAGEEGGAGIFEEILGRMRPGRAGAKPQAPRMGRNLEANLTIPLTTAVRGGETAIDILRNNRRESLVVKIPPGIESGAKLRLRGQGEAGPVKGSPAGDLTISVTVEPHNYFVLDGRNLTVELPLTVSEALLGARVDVPTLDGLKALTIPPGSSSGQKLRLRGQGVPTHGDKPEGDLFVILKIVLPKNVDDESRRLIREFAERNPLNPRNGLW